MSFFSNCILIIIVVNQAGKLFEYFHSTCSKKEITINTFYTQEMQDKIIKKIAPNFLAFVREALVCISQKKNCFQKRNSLVLQKFNIPKQVLFLYWLILIFSLTFYAFDYMASEGKSCNRKTLSRHDKINLAQKKEDIMKLILNTFCGVYFDNYSRYDLFFIIIEGFFLN